MPEPAGFSIALERLFRDLHTRWLELAPDEIVITDERLRQELAIPVGLHGRICYFVLPAILVSFYRDAVFPLADHAGLVAATGDETLGRGGTLRAMIDMLLNRADVVIADVSTGDRRVRRELRAASRRVPPPEVAVISDTPVVEESAQLAPRVFLRPSTRLVGGAQGPTVSVTDSSNWLEPVGTWLDTAGANVMNRLISQVRKLEPTDRTAVITSANALEITLQRTLAVRRTGPAMTTTMAGSRLTVLINQAVERELLTVDDANQARLLQQARAVAVHGEGPADAAATKALVDQATKMINRLTPQPRRPKADPKPKRPSSR